MASIFCLLFAGLLCIRPAICDTIGNTGLPQPLALNDGTGNVPPAQMSGWFSGSNSWSDPSQNDPSQIWTSAENLALMNYWLSLITQAGGDPALLRQLYGLGMTDSQIQQATLNSPFSQANSQQSAGNVPEPATLGLLGCGLAFFGLYAGNRIRRMGPLCAFLRETPIPAVNAPAKNHVSLRRSDRSGSR